MPVGPELLFVLIVSVVSHSEEAEGIPVSTLSLDPLLFLSIGRMFGKNKEVLSFTE